MAWRKQLADRKRTNDSFLSPIRDWETIREFVRPTDGQNIRRAEKVTFAAILFQTSLEKFLC